MIRGRLDEGAPLSARGAPTGDGGGVAFFDQLMEEFVWSLVEVLRRIGKEAKRGGGCEERGMG